jgi:hypothetical protein
VKLLFGLRTGKPVLNVIVVLNGLPFSAMNFPWGKVMKDSVLVKSNYIALKKTY